MRHSSYIQTEASKPIRLQRTRIILEPSLVLRVDGFTVQVIDQKTYPYRHHCMVYRAGKLLHQTTQVTKRDTALAMGREVCHYIRRAEAEAALAEAALAEAE